MVDTPTPAPRSARPARWLRRMLGAPFAVLAAIALAQTLPTLWSKDVWFPDELRHAAVLRGLLDHGHWLVLHLGEAVYPDKPPLYFWLLAGLAALTGTTGPVLYMLAAALSGVGFLAALAALGRALGAGRRVVLVAGLILLSNWFFIDRMHQPRMDLMFAALIMLAHLGFYRAARDAGADSGAGLHPGWAALGAALAMLAVLTKGPVGLMLPTLSLVLFLALRGRPGALASRGGAVALGVVVAIGGAYLGAVAAIGGTDAIRALLIEQTIDRARGGTGNAQPVWWYVPQVATAFLPWSLLVLVLPWSGLATGLRRLRAASDGVLWLALSLGGGFIALSLIGYKVVHMIVPLYGLLALAAGWGLAGLAAARRRLLFTGVALFLVVAAALLPLAAGWTRWPEAVHGAWAVAAALALAALVAWAARRRGAAGFTLALALAMTVVALPFYLVTVRGLNPVMAPRAAGAVLAAHGAAGYRLVEYDPVRAYLGHFHYHAGYWLEGATDAGTLEAMIGDAPCVVLALPVRALASADAPRGDFVPLMEVPMDARPYRLMRRAGEGCALPEGP